MEEPPPENDDLETRAKALKIRLPHSSVHDYFQEALVKDDKKVARKGCICQSGCGASFITKNSTTLKGHLATFHKEKHQEMKSKYPKEHY